MTSTDSLRRLRKPHIGLWRLVICTNSETEETDYISSGTMKSIASQLKLSQVVAY
jgi:hypothetical protein